MKKIISIILCLALTLTVLSACGNNANVDNGKLNIVTTIFPEYDWVRNIVMGIDNINLTMLLDTGVDLHSFQPTADDIIKISTCDMFIYVGGESDAWVDDALKNATNKDMIVIDLLDILKGTVKQEEIVEGMQGEEEEESEEGPEYDEHVWLSLKNAKTICEYISSKLCEIDTFNAEAYNANTKIYTDKLDKLDSDFASTIQNAKVKTILFGDRFPFRYLVDDYGLNYYAAFVGCSAESEASFETISFLAKKVDELGLNAVFALDGSDQKIANTIISNTKTKNQKILALNSMQSTTKEDIESGVTYLSIMENNLTALKEALN